MSEQLELLNENSSHWATVSYIAPEIQKKEIKPFVVLAVEDIEGTPDSRTSSLVSTDKFSAVRSVVRHVARLRSCRKEPWNEADMKTFLEGLRFSSECVSELSMLLCAEQIYENIPPHMRVKPGVVSLFWKIDLSLSQSNMQGDLDPQQMKEILHHNTHIILIFNLTNGQRKTYRLSISKFSEIRYTVASALKSMIVLEKRKCMRRE